EFRVVKLHCSCAPFRRLAQKEISPAPAIALFPPPIPERRGRPLGVEVSAKDFSASANHYESNETQRRLRPALGRHRRAGRHPGLCPACLPERAATVPRRASW